MELEGGSKAPNIQGSFKSHLLMHLHVKMNKAQMMEAFLGQKKKKKIQDTGGSLAPGEILLSFQRVKFRTKDPPHPDGVNLQKVGYEG